MKVFLSKYKKLLFLCFLLVLIIVERIELLINFGFEFIDSDQALMWYGAQEYMHGRFHEPCFFGQSYNSLLEAFLSVPFISAGVAVRFALPVITSALALFPYIFSAILLFRKHFFAQAYMVLLILLLLPTEYGMLTTIPRGFVTGIFAVSFAYLTLIKPENLKAIFSAGFFGMLGFALNPNSVLLIVPIWLFILQYNYKRIKAWMYFVSGVLPAAILFYLSKLFYVLHLEYDVHKQAPITYSYKWMLDSIQSLDEYFIHITPAFWANGSLIIILFTGIIILLCYQKKWQLALALLSGIAFAVVSLGVNKIHDGTESVFFSLGRMYLALPVLLAFFTSRLNISLQKLSYLLIFLLAATSFTVKHISLKDKIAYNIAPERNHIINIAQREHLLHESEILAQTAKKYDASLLVLIDYYYADIVNYAGAILNPELPATLKPLKERRTWVLQHEENTLHKNILFLCLDSSLMRPYLQKETHISKINEFTGLYLLTNNNEKTISLLRRLGIKIRPYKS
ncbi:MAG: hypothetical protein EOO04_07995 [Chitinophagaceae bacterium]|nr:MAG: hypothetical protein EOO04_07995 [Chitinophagaceae bacterium]